jgi:hypothetical protein
MPRMITLRQPMSKLPLGRLLARLTALALTVAPATGVARPGELPAELEDDREIDRAHLDRHAAAAALGRGLAHALVELRPLAATQLAASWALSTEPLRRHAVALALEWSFPLVGETLLIEHLADDPDPQIRAASARAAWARRTSGIDPAVLARLAEDPDPEVRAVALAARGP